MEGVVLSALYTILSVWWSNTYLFKPTEVQVDTGARKLVPPALFFHVASAAVLTIAWTPNSQQLIAACESDEGSSRSGQVCIKVCQVPEGSDGNEARILDLEIEAGPLRTFCCSADGKYLFRIDTEQNLV